MRVVVAVVAAVFFAVPIGLRAVGVTATQFENKRFAERPRLSEGWGVFDQATRFFTDRMPLRQQAVEANTWISRNVFGRTPHYGVAEAQPLPFGSKPPTGGARKPPGAPAPPSQPAPTSANQVTAGRDGWLYLTGELDRACQRFIAYPTAARRWARLVRMVHASGRRVVLIVPPDKSTIYPEHLPGSYADKACLPKGRAEAWRSIEHTGQPGVIGLRRPLLAASRSTSKLLYWPKDTHWNQLGAIWLVREALPALHSGVKFENDAVHVTTTTNVGDLSRLLGAPAKDVGPAIRLERRPGAPTIPGRTLIVYDSFGVAALDLLRPYFSELREIEWFDNTPRSIAREIAAADTVILESVEREFDFRASDQGYLANGFFHLLQRDLGRSRTG